MTRDFNILFNQIDEDIKSDIQDREARQDWRDERDEGGYEDLVGPFAKDVPAKGGSLSQSFKEISFRLNGTDVIKHGYPNILKTAVDKLGVKIDDLTARSELEEDDLPGLDDAFSKIDQGQSYLLSSVQ